MIEYGGADEDEGPWCAEWPFLVLKSDEDLRAWTQGRFWQSKVLAA